jgi:hypothetical protein
MLAATVSEKRMASSSTVPVAPRSDDRVSWRTSAPPTLTVPAAGS